MRGPLSQGDFSFPLEKKKLVRDLSIWAPLWNLQAKKSENLDPRMRKCDEHQTLVHLDVHVCPVFVCVWGGGGGGGTLFIYTYTPK